MINGIYSKLHRAQSLVGGIVGVDFRLRYKFMIN